MDPISNMIVAIKNGQASRKEMVSVPFSKVKFHIATLLKEAGYLSSVERRKRKAKKAELEYIDMNLQYASEVGAISGIRIVSRPSRHLYIKAADIRPVRSGFGAAVISTSKGIMTSHEAKKANLGGELLFEIW